MALSSCKSADVRLLVRHLPASLTAEDKTELLTHFGATEVTVMPKKSKLLRLPNLRNSAFVTFPDAVKARKALVRLHQLSVLNNRLVVEYARPEHAEGEEKHREATRDSSTASVSDEKGADDRSSTGSGVHGQRHDVAEGVTNHQATRPSLAAQYGLPFSERSDLHYLYPPPTANVIINIAHTLACVPKFYVQVLHLMNKMHLPCPFGPVTPSPLLMTGQSISEDVPDESLHSPLLASDESEMSSDGERLMQDVQHGAMTGFRKQPKAIKRRLATCKPPGNELASKRAKPVDRRAVFVDVEARPSIDLSAAIEAAFEAGQAKLLATSLSAAEESAEVVASEEKETSELSGFGKFAPVPVVMVEEPAEEDLSSALEHTISRRELRSGRLSSDEMEKLPVFRNYTTGNPTCRLYIKNIDKTVVEADLRHIFGRFVDRHSEEHLDRFNIRLMQEGRMKGQAFVTLADEIVAGKALQETNGFVLCNKPMVVQFARSARAK